MELIKTIGKRERNPAAWEEFGIMRGVIFDFNGTLFFDGEQQERAWRLFAREAFGKEISEEEFQECVHGRNNDFIMQRLSERSLSARQVDEYVEAKETIYRRLCREDLARFHLALGAEELLDELRERGIPRTIATASRRKNVDFYIESFGLERWFDAERIVYDDGTILGKPAPDFYLRAAEALGLQPKDCIVFEDAVSGLRAAAAAGAGKVIALAPEERRAAFERMSEVYEVIPNFHEFDRLLLRE